MSVVSYYSKESLAQLQEKLHKLKTVDRLFISQQLAEARDKGDLSENAEYDAAKEAQGLLELKISKLEETLVNARVLDEDAINTSKVSILTKIKLRNEDNGSEFTYKLVSESEANIKENKLSITSPIGRGILDKEVGDVVQVKVPSGVINLKILDISI